MTTDKHIAAVDMGTNSFHMIIAKTEPQGGFRIIDRMKHWVRLGDGVDARGNLDQPAIERMIESLNYFKQLADGYNAYMHCIATSAMRDAPNRHTILERIHQELNLVVDIVSGDEEARLVFQGVRSEGYIGVNHAHVIDIGGGSTEVIIGNNEGVEAAESMDMGARRYSRMFFANGAYTKAQLNKCHHAAASKIQSVAADFKPFPVQSVYGTSGTIRTLSEITAILCNRSDSTHLLLSDLQSIRGDLIKGVKEGKLPGEVESERADTLVAGSIILEEVMSALNISSLRVCLSALREGIIFDRIETEGRLPAKPIEASSRAMAKRFMLNQEQIRCVSTTAKHVFNHYAEALNLNAEAKSLLLAACQLHEIGLTISHKKIHMHGSYIIANSNITGITQRQQQMLAAIIRFHRKTQPTKKQVALKAMRNSDISTTLAVAAILRIAAALNRTKSGVAAAPRFEESKKYHIWHFEDSEWFQSHEVCIWNASSEKRPLGKLLGKPIRFKRPKPIK